MFLLLMVFDFAMHMQTHVLVAIYPVSVSRALYKPVDFFVLASLFFS